MAENYRFILHYFVDVTCLSPLRTGSAERNTEEVLRNHEGLPILQGTSLAGSLRDWKEDDVLWGTSEKEGQLIVSDLVFQWVQPTIRPRVMLDGKSGTVKHKYDIAALPKGTTGHFEIIWRGLDGQEAAKEKITEYLSALNNGAISLGAQKANGYGMVSLKVSASEYDLKNASDREAWLDGKESKKNVRLEGKKASYIRFTVHADTNSILVKAGSESGYGDNGLKGVQLQENGERIIPGSSIKGAVRAHLERIAPNFGAEKLIPQYFGCAAQKDIDGISGKLRFSDGKFRKDSISSVQNRIRINRLSGGVFEKALFREEFMHGHVSWEIRIPSDSGEICALLLYALRDLYLGLYNIGGGYAIGRGQFSCIEVAVSTPEGNARMECRESGITLKDSAGTIARWQTALEGYRHET